MKLLSVLVRRSIATTMSLCLLLALSCQKEGVVNLSSDGKSSFSDPTLEYILSLGFKKEKVVDHGKYYVVEGDILFDKVDASGNARISQLAHYITPLANHDIVDNISVHVGELPDSDWQNKMIAATQAAIISWNNDISNKKVHFYYTSSSTATITVIDTLGLGSLYAMATFPNCSVGNKIKINRTTYGLNDAQRHFVMAHELGHCIGLRHTDETPSSTDNYLIQGTPSSDDPSIMNTNGPKPANGVPNWPGFSNYDKIAVRTLYPTTPVATAVYNGTSDKIEFTWTTSYFCNKNVTIQVKLPSGSYNQAITVANKGIYSFEPVNSGTYQIFVSNSSKSLDASVVF